MYKQYTWKEYYEGFYKNQDEIDKNIFLPFPYFKTE